MAGLKSENTIHECYLFFAILRTPTAMPSIMGPRHGKMLENKVGKSFASGILSQIFVRIAKKNPSL